MKVVIACLLLAVAFATRETVQPSMNYGGLSMAEVQQIEELRNTKWGSIFLTMAELQVQVGPMERLNQALDDLLKELSQSKASEKKRFQQKKASHESIVATLKSNIAAATSDVNKNKQLISGVLIPRQKQAEADITRSEATILQKKKDIQTETSKRNVEHAGFQQRVTDHNNAIAAVDECLGLLNGLTKGSASLIEMRKATMSIRRLEAKIKHTGLVETAFVEALITLATEQNFANKESIQKVLSMLGDFRAKLAKSLQTERANEAKAVAAFNTLMAQINKEIDQQTAEIRKNTALISQTKIDIDNANNQIMVKTHEILELNAKLDSENEAWRQETNVHKELMIELHKEIKTIKDCKALFAKNQFSSYVSGKVNKGDKNKKKSL